MHIITLLHVTVVNYGIVLMTNYLTAIYVIIKMMPFVLSVLEQKILPIGFTTVIIVETKRRSLIRSCKLRTDHIQKVCNSCNRYCGRLRRQVYVTVGDNETQYQCYTCYQYDRPTKVSIAIFNIVNGVTSKDNLIITMTLITSISPS